MVFCFLAITKIQLFIEKLLFLPHYFGVGNFSKVYDHQLSKADSIMDIADDSAQIAIKMLDALKPEWSKFTKAQRMRYDLLYHKAMVRCVRYIGLTINPI